MSTFKTSAHKILKSSPLHYREIIRLALEQGLLETEGATPEASMNSQLSTDIKTLGKKSRFIRVSPGTFALNPHAEPLDTKSEKKVREVERKSMEKKVHK